METQSLTLDVKKEENKFYWVRFEGKYNINSAYPAAVGIYRKRLIVGVVEGSPFDLEDLVNKGEEGVAFLTDYKEISKKDFLVYMFKAKMQGKLHCLRTVY